MALIRQCLLHLSLSRSMLRQRWASSLAIVLTMAFVTGVSISMLSITAGIVREFDDAGDPRIVIVLPAKQAYDNSSDLPRGAVGTILDAPGIMRGPDGKPLADPEVLLYVPPDRRIATGAGLRIHGIGAAGTALRPRFRIVSGRMFVPGRQELIIGAAAQRTFGLRVGDMVTMRNGAWPIVGAFTAAGVVGSELLGDADTIAAMMHWSGLGSVLVRLEDRARFPAFKRWLTTNPALEVSAEPQLDYYARIAAGESQYFTAMACIAGAILSAGALFGSVNVLYGVARARAREMATLRAIGYGALPVAASVVFEAVVLALAGAAAGALVAWLRFDGREILQSENLYRLIVSPQLVGLGFAWALALSLLGSLPPAIKAARAQVADALRAA